MNTNDMRAHFQREGFTSRAALVASGSVPESVMNRLAGDDAAFVEFAPLVAHAMRLAWDAAIQACGGPDIVMRGLGSDAATAAFTSGFIEGELPK